jgi:monofunctional biosynthetic peptidoglycan transglycosylase
MTEKKKGLVSRLCHFVTFPYRWLNRLFYWTGFALWTNLIVSLAIAGYWWKTLPNLSQNGFEKSKQLASSRLEKKIGKSVSWVDIDQISRNAMYAVVFSEDSQFFEHSGFDVDATLNAMAENIRKRKFEYGASTITQQVAKNIFLSNEKSFTRKLKEVVLSKRLELNLTKNKILELYLNIAEFGPNLYGVKEASRHYFSKEPSQLNAAEGAYLALLLPSPRKYHFALFENGNLSAQHRAKLKRILNDMSDAGFISELQAKEYSRYDFPVRPQERIPAQVK